MTDRPTMPRTWVLYQAGVPMKATFQMTRAIDLAIESGYPDQCLVFEVTPRTPATDAADDAVAALRELVLAISEHTNGRSDRSEKWQKTLIDHARSNARQALIWNRIHTATESARAILVRVDGGGNVG